MDSVTPEQVLQAIERLATQGKLPASSSEIVHEARGSSATVRRHLEALSASGHLIRTGRARATRYTLALPVRARVTPPALSPQGATEPSPKPNLYAQPDWSQASTVLRERLSAPLGARDPVTYHRDFVDGYRPNESFLLPQALAEELYQAGRLFGQQPAGTYARKVFEQLLVDLSWSSSHLEGNRYTLLATKELFERGVDGDDADAQMLLNHKRAIEFLVEGVPTQGLTTAVLRNLHATLMEALLANDGALGAIRNTVVNISDTVYVPAQVSAVLQEMLQAIVDKARLIKNPIEGAFFLWVNIAYLQPFEDGNKRTSRLAANIPLMLYNCAPLSFLDVDPSDYAPAMLGIYELRDTSAAVDLFTWTYRRSIKKYTVVKDSFAAPDPRRLRYRPAIEEAIRMIVMERKSAYAAIEALRYTEDKAPGFAAMLTDTLEALGEYNCARFRLTPDATKEWVDAGRPM